MSTPTPSALLVPDPRFEFPGFSGSGSTTTYTEADPTAAGPVPLLAGAMTLAGAQLNDLNFTFVRGGPPDQSRAARIVWSENSGSAYGWAPPSFICSLKYIGLAGYAADGVVLPDGRIAVIAPAATGAGAVYQCVVYDPYDDTSTTPVSIGVSTDSDRALVAIRYEPLDSSLWALAQEDLGTGDARRFRLVKSDDYGATWVSQGDAVFTSSPPLGGLEPANKCRWYTSGGQHYLYVISANDGGISAGDSTLSVYASVGGSVWGVVASLTASVGAGINANACDVLYSPTTGRVIIAINELVSSTNTLRVYVTAPGSDPSVGSSSDLSNSLGLVTSLDLVEEDTGRMWLFATDTSGNVESWRSIDSGLTWVANANRQIRRGSLGSSWASTRVLNSGGASYLLAQAYNAGAWGAIYAIKLGGWTQVEPYAAGGTLPQQPADTNRMTWGMTPAGAVDWGSATYLPWQAPSTQGWTEAGLGSRSGSTITTTANTKTAEALSALAGAEHPQVTMMAQVRTVSGGSTASTDIGMRLRSTLVGGVSDVGVDVRFSATEIAAVDVVSGATLGTLAFSTTTDAVVWALLDGARVEIYVRRPYSATWSSVAQGSLSTTPSTGAFVRWGHIASSTAESVWTFVASAWSVPGNASNNYWKSELSSVPSRQNLLGRPISSTGAALGDPRIYPQASLIGIAQPREIVTAAPLHHRPIVHLDPAQYSARSAVWRSEDTSEQIFEFRPGAVTNPGRSLGLAVVGANWRTTYLERWTGSAWAITTTLDLAATTAGNASLIAASADIALVQGVEFDTNELVGGTIIFASGDARKITANTAGVVTAPGAIVRFAGADGTETDGTCTIIVPTGATTSVAHNPSDRWRVRIPTQTTADGFFQASKIIIGGWVQFGLNDEHGRTVQVIPSVESRGQDGTRVRRSAPGRTYGLLFPTQVLLRDAKSYLMGAGGGVTGFLGDTFALLDGLLRGPSDGLGLDTLPCMLVFSPETSAGELNWKRKNVVYGRVEGSVAQTWAAGLESETTVDRPDRLTFVELP